MTRTAPARPRVLAVEDEPDYRLVLGEWLGREFEAVVVDSPERLFEEARARRPDAVILDLGLPGVDGVDLCRRVREAPETAGVPAVVLSAFREEALYRKTLEEGVKSYLVKPIDGQALRRRLWRLIED
ncbi:MAG: response regulator [Elusimicrobia bacterium]|nr:response regulator [Elusimicrobiota bacterium]